MDVKRISISIEFVYGVFRVYVVNKRHGRGYDGATLSSVLRLSRFMHALSQVNPAQVTRAFEE